MAAVGPAAQCTTEQRDSEHSASASTAYGIQHLAISIDTPPPVQNAAMSRSSFARRRTRNTESRSRPRGISLNMATNKPLQTVDERTISCLPNYLRARSQREQMTDIRQDDLAFVGGMLDVCLRPRLSLSGSRSAQGTGHNKPTVRFIHPPTHPGPHGPQPPLSNVAG